MYPILYIHHVLKIYQQQLQTKGKPPRVLVRRDVLEVKDKVTLSREAKELYAKAKLEKG